MKTLIISRPRTRSNLLIHAHTMFHDIIDKHEEYTMSTGKIMNANIKDTKFKFSMFQSEIKKVTERNFKEGNFAIKLFPRMLIPHCDFYDLSILRNLSYNLNIKKYDNIYFLERDVVDSACSYMYSIYIKSFSFTDTEEAKKTFKEYGNLTVNVNDPELNFYIYEAAIILKIKEFLEKNKINYTTLEYDDIPKYVNNNYPSITPKTVDNELDYSEVISNYTELKEHILIKYQTSILRTYSLSFY